MADIERLRQELQSEDCAVVAEAAAALVATGEHFDADTLARTHHCLIRTWSGRKRVGLARSYLHLLDPDRAGAEAEHLLRSERHPEVRDEVFHALIDFGERAIPALRKLVRSRDATVRWYAYRAAHRIGGPDSILLLVDGLRDEDTALRIFAADALVTRHDAVFLPVLHALAAREPSSGFHRAALTVLTRTALPEYQEALAPLLRSLASPWTVYESGFIAGRLLAELPPQDADAEHTPAR
jgi:hypothetical protein